MEEDDGWKFDMMSLSLVDNYHIQVPMRYLKISIAKRDHVVQDEFDTERLATGEMKDLKNWVLVEDVREKVEQDKETQVYDLLIMGSPEVQGTIEEEAARGEGPEYNSGVNQPGISNQAMATVNMLQLYRISITPSTREHQGMPVRGFPVGQTSTSDR